MEYVDIPRAPTKNRKRYVQGGIAAGGLILVTILLASLSPAAPGVDREVVSVDGVRRGTMVREGRGPGPGRTHFRPARHSGKGEHGAARAREPGRPDRSARRAAPAYGGRGRSRQ